MPDHLEISPMNGQLYVVATPIGNLKDITLRAIDILRNVDIVVAENRGRALGLLTHLGIRKPIISINSYNEEKKGGSIVERLANGQSCALISSAGTPCISDPGNVIVRRCYDAGIRVATIPGPSALVSALSISGLFADRFLFFGFLPQKQGKKRKTLQELASLSYPIVFFESPRRLLDTLSSIREIFGNPTATVVKEMTKVHEETFRGTTEELIESLSAKEVRGEYVVIVGGRGKSG
jgi:16S rRNA (cytidine1402-2'-O)-methyltransferase